MKVKLVSVILSFVCLCFTSSVFAQTNRDGLIKPQNSPELERWLRAGSLPSAVVHSTPKEKLLSGIAAALVSEDAKLRFITMKYLLSKNAVSDKRLLSIVHDMLIKRNKLFENSVVDEFKGNEFYQAVLFMGKYPDIKSALFLSEIASKKNMRFIDYVTSSDGEETNMANYDSFFPEIAWAIKKCSKGEIGDLPKLKNAFYWQFENKKINLLAASWKKWCEKKGLFVIDGQIISCKPKKEPRQPINSETAGENNPEKAKNLSKKNVQDTVRKGPIDATKSDELETLIMDGKSIAQYEKNVPREKLLSGFAAAILSEDNVIRRKVIRYVLAKKYYDKRIAPFIYKMLEQGSDADIAETIAIFLHKNPDIRAVPVLIKVAKRNPIIESGHVRSTEGKILSDLPKFRSIFPAIASAIKACTKNKVGDIPQTMYGKKLTALSWSYMTSERNKFIAEWEKWWQENGLSLIKKQIISCKPKKEPRQPINSETAGENNPEKAKNLSKKNVQDTGVRKGPIDATKSDELETLLKNIHKSHPNVFAKINSFNIEKQLESFTAKVDNETLLSALAAALTSEDSDVRYMAMGYLLSKKGISDERILPFLYKAFHKMLVPEANVPHDNIEGTLSRWSFNKMNNPLYGEIVDRHDGNESWLLVRLLTKHPKSSSVPILLQIGLRHNIRQAGNIRTADGHKLSDMGIKNYFPEIALALAKCSDGKIGKMDKDYQWWVGKNPIALIKKWKAWWDKNGLSLIKKQIISYKPKKEPREPIINWL